ncbi:type II toxin-antitoxin system VapC family toxin [Arcobacter sp.]|uniref:type II toxin-antitoxin system VapC family toxin n=2 Tax=Arcobacter sp. TaxID=1872629 RepID=UPI003D09C463
MKNMYKKVFLDANIFIDVNDKKRVSYEESFKIISYLLINEVEIYTSCDLITTIYYILSKNDKLNALYKIDEINDFCKIIEFSNQEVKQTCELMKTNPKYKDLEDTIQYILAKKEGCDLIISNDKEFISDDIELLTTAKFIEKLNIV